MAAPPSNCAPPSSADDSAPGCRRRLARRIGAGWQRALARADAAVADWPLGGKIAVPLIVALVLSVALGALAAYRLELTEQRDRLAGEAATMARLLAADQERLNRPGDLHSFFHQIEADPKVLAVFLAAPPQLRPARLLARNLAHSKPLPDLTDAIFRSLVDQQPVTAFDGSQGAMIYAAPVLLPDRHPIRGDVLGALGMVMDAGPLHGTALKGAMLAAAQIFLLASIVLGLVFIALRRAVLHPLSAAQAAVVSIRNGDPSVRVPVRGKDEIGQLAAALNDAFDSVAEKEARLADQVTELEQARAKLDEQRGKLSALAKDLDLARLKAEAGSRAKSEFLAMVSHEIRTPMNGVLGTLQLLLDGRLAGEERRLAELARESASSLLTLIDDILDFSKLEVGRVKLEEIDFNLNHVVDSVVSLLSVRAADKGIQLRSLIDPETPPLLRGDPARLRQILFNLVGNAIKFTERGSVTLRTRHRLLADGRVELRIDVVDTGIGIAPETLPGLFTRYTQADASIARRFGGTGLGLAICKQLVELMEGSIAVESRPGEGSRFSFTLRCRPGEAADPAGGHGAAAPRTRRLRILVAEDNAVNQLLAKAMLESLGHEPVVVGDGREAVQALAGGGFDLVLMDLHMPVMDGVAAIRAIRALDGPQSAVPIIALSADTAQESGTDMAELGIDGYVTKPIDPQRLVAAMATCTGAEAAAAPRLDRNPESLRVDPAPGDDAAAAMRAFLASVDALQTAGCR